MKAIEKINELNNIIERTLVPLIDKDYVYLDLPYHNNIGDILIWEGTESFLNKIPFKCIYKSSDQTFKDLEIPKDIIILLHGGGNFGDTWRKHMEFRLSIVEKYPNNKIIVLPQTVYYKNKNFLISDSNILNKHKNLTICGRDLISTSILTKYFTAQIFMLPDMAFCINPESLKKLKKKEEERVLLLMRKDKELNKEMEVKKYIQEKGELEIYDWPTLEYNKYYIRTCDKILSINGGAFGIVDFYADRHLRPKLVRIGVSFLSKYKYVYANRLHVAILSILLNKSFVLFDNIYGKNSGFYETWLSDLEDAELIIK